MDKVRRFGLTNPLAEFSAVPAWNPYQQAQVVFKEQAPWFTIAHAVQLKPVRKNVIGYQNSPFGRHSFYGVDIKE